MALGSTSFPSPRRIHLLGPAATPQALERLERRRRVVGAGRHRSVPLGRRAGRVARVRDSIHKYRLSGVPFPSWARTLSSN